MHWRCVVFKIFLVFEIFVVFRFFVCFRFGKFFIKYSVSFLCWFNPLVFFSPRVLVLYQHCWFSTFLVFLGPPVLVLVQSLALFRSARIAQKENTFHTQWVLPIPIPVACQKLSDNLSTKCFLKVWKIRFVDWIQLFPLKPGYS